MSRNGSIVRLAGGLAVAGALLACGGGDEASRAEGSRGVALAADAAQEVVVYKTPTCGCCASWVEHLEAAGFDVEVHDTSELWRVKAEAGVPGQLQSCHTARVGDYVIEGHVPADAIVRLLNEQPDVRGLAVPDMPIGSPGMEQGDRREPYDILTFDAEGRTEVYESR